MDRAGLGTYEQWTDEAGNKHTKWEGFTWHGLRHTFASWLGQSGAPEMVIDQLCGWAEICDERDANYEMGRGPIPPDYDKRRKR